MKPAFQHHDSGGGPGRKCEYCGKPIAPARLEVLPDTTQCVACAAKHPKKLDTSFVDLSQASPINRNGFAPKD